MELKFSEFQFGPPIMRMLYTANRPDLAYELFTDSVSHCTFLLLLTCVLCCCMHNITYHIQDGLY